MFGAGWTEMLIIGVVALVVIGPKDLPVVMAKLGRMVRTVRRMGDEFRRELDKTTGLDQITELRRSITEPLRQTSDEIIREFNRQTETGVEPSGIMKPIDPNVESVYDQIAATSGLPMKTAAAPVAEAGPEPLPAPAEAAPSAAKPRRSRKPKTAEAAPAAPAKPKRRAAPKAANTAPVEPAPAPIEATPAAVPVKAAAPRRRATAGKADAGNAANDSVVKPRRVAHPRADAAKPAEAAPRLPAEEA